MTLISYLLMILAAVFAQASAFLQRRRVRRALDGATAVALRAFSLFGRPLAGLAAHRSKAPPSGSAPLGMPGAGAARGRTKRT